MVYCLCSWAITFVVDIILRNIKAKYKKKPAIRILKGIRLVIFTSALVMTIWFPVQATYQKIKKTNENHYIVKTIYTSQDEPYYIQVDPAAFVNDRQSDGTSDSDQIHEENSNGNENSEEPPVISPLPPTNEPKEIYDFSLLMFFGEYTFGEYITPEDLDNMRNMYHAYWNDKKYQDIITEMLHTGTESPEELDRRINEFDMKVNNGNTITAKEHYQNAKDRFYRYGGKEENISFLEQSAISAENAAECEDIETSGGYSLFFQYIRSSVISFSGVLGSGDTQYPGSKEYDIKYRMGKLMCKPALNLKNITLSEKYYSLCSSYVLLKDAFDHSSLDSTYAVEVAYYYLLVCNDIVNVMEPERSQEMRDRVRLAYYQLWERVREKPYNPTYKFYCQEAELIIEKLMQ